MRTVFTGRGELGVRHNDSRRRPVSNLGAVCLVRYKWRISAAAVRAVLQLMTWFLAGAEAHAASLRLLQSGPELVLRWTLDSEARFATLYAADDLPVGNPPAWQPILSFTPAAEWEMVLPEPAGSGNRSRFFRLEQSRLVLSPDMVWIGPGEFVMGSPESEPGRYPDEGPPRTRQVTAGFWLNRHEVTQQEFIALVGVNPSKSMMLSDDRLPVDSVTWHDAVSDCEKLTARERAAGRLPPDCVCRLPTEAEWDYACRAQSTAAYHFGDDPALLSQFGWWADNGGPWPHPVAGKPANAWGLHDMHGNVFEWRANRYEAYPGGHAHRGRDLCVARGGAFYCPANILRSACRFESRTTSYASWLVGFRVALGFPGGGP